MNGSGLATLTAEEITRIPKRTLAELAAPASSGERHFQMRRLVIPMLGNGIMPERVFAVLRSIYAEDVGDKEIWDYIGWAAAKPFTPSGYSNTSQAPRSVLIRRPTVVPNKLVSAAKVANAERFLAGFRCAIDDLRRASPAKAQEGVPLLQAELFFSFLYTREDGSEYPDHFINVVNDFQLDEKGKALPRGPGKSLTRDGWRRYLKGHGVPQNDAGAWVRLNSAKATGSGAGGACTDADVLVTRYVLLESDCLPLPLQASLLAKLPVPIVAIIDSGGKSLHGILKLPGDDAAEGKQLLRQLAILGFDPANHNPSRLSRLPGALRRIGARDHAGSYQSLIYLDNTPLWPLEPDKPWNEQSYPRPGGTIL